MRKYRFPSWSWAPPARWLWSWLLPARSWRSAWPFPSHLWLNLRPWHAKPGAEGFKRFLSPLKSFDQLGFIELSIFKTKKTTTQIQMTVQNAWDAQYISKATFSEWGCFILPKICVKNEPPVRQSRSTLPPPSSGCGYPTSVFCPQHWITSDCLRCGPRINTNFKIC